MELFETNHTEFHCSSHKSQLSWSADDEKDFYPLIINYRNAPGFARGSFRFRYRSASQMPITCNRNTQSVIIHTTEKQAIFNTDARNITCVYEHCMCYNLLLTVVKYNMRYLTVISSINFLTAQFYDFTNELHCWS